MDFGVAYIPEDRNSDGIVGDMEIWENAIMTEMDDSYLRNSLGIINKKTSFDRSENLCETYDANAVDKTTKQITIWRKCTKASFGTLAYEKTKNNNRLSTNPWT